MPEKDHPIWSILRTAIVGFVCVFALWSNYDSVDHRDLYTLAEVMAIAGGMDLWTHRKT